MIEHLGLKVLHVPTTGQPTMDIVAVHGKGAHPAHTWGALRAEDLDPRNEANYVNWLADDQMLPAALPTARILRYGYPSEWFGENALAITASSVAEKLLLELKSLRLFDPDRPLIFIAHSFGGLVVLKTLLLAQQEIWKWQSISGSTAGLVFLGTPFRGTHDMLHTEILHNVEMLFQDSQIMFENHRSSKADNTWLRDLVDDFFRLLRSSAHMPKIACFYEEKVTDLGLFLKNKAGYVFEPGKYKVMHVDETSACLDRTSTFIEKYGRACDHLAMNKFVGATHPEWLTMRRVLVDMAEQESAQAPSIFPALSIASQATFDAQNKQDEPDCLPGTRTDVLSTIRQWISDNDAPPIFWLSGTAGAGKSTIARTISREFNSKSLLGASFFFSRDGGETLSGARLIYTTIANQLARAGPADLRHAIRKAAQDNPDILDKSRTYQWTTLVLDALKLTRRTGEKITRAIIIDALDECNDENEIRALIPLLSRVTEATSFNIRILLVSRPDPPIREGLAEINQSAVRHLSLDEQTPEIVDSDIRLYLIDRCQRIKKKQLIVDQNWPEVRSISRLVRLSAGLFIYAATACDFIQDDIDRNAEASLTWFIEEMERTEQQYAPPSDDDVDMEHTAHIDRMYTRILQNALREGKSEVQKNRLCAYLKDLIGAVVASQEPLPPGALQTLRAVKGEDVRWRLNRLHSVIRVPQTDDASLRLSHIAFRDFLLDARRCLDTRFILDGGADHGRLHQNCMNVLEASMRRDICDVRHPAASSRKVEPHVVERALPGWLRYACKHWIGHAILSDNGLNFVEPMHTFLEKHLLHWLEAMGWIAQSQESTHLLGTLHSYFKNRMVGNVRELCSFFKDAHRFALFSQSVLEAAPLQIYCSALLFAPQSSLTRIKFQNDVCPWIKECGNRNPRWDECLQIQSTPFEKFDVAAMAVSHNLKLVASATNEGSIQVWNMSTKDSTQLASLRHSVEDLAFSCDDKMLAAYSAHGICGLWNTNSGHMVRTDDCDIPLYALAFSRDGLTIRVLGMRRPSLYEPLTAKLISWDVMTGARTEHEPFVLESAPSEKCRISPNLVAAGLPNGQRMVLVTMPDEKTPPTQRMLMGHEQPVSSAAFSQDGATVATACVRSVRTWDATTGECRSIISTGFRGSDDMPPPPPIFSPDGFTIAARYRRASLLENYIGLWNTENGSERKVIATKFTLNDFAWAFASDGESLVVLSNGEGNSVVSRTWDTLGTPRVSDSVKTNTKTPSEIALSEAGGVVAVAYADALFEIWDVAAPSPTATCKVSWQESSEFAGARSLALSNNGKRLGYEKVLSTEESDPLDNVRVRDTDTGEAIPHNRWSDSAMAGLHIGTYDDGFSCVEMRHSMLSSAASMPIADSWLCFNAEPVILLPSQCQLHGEYRADHQTVSVIGQGNAMALLFASGRFSILRFQPVEMQGLIGRHAYIPQLTKLADQPTVSWDTDRRRI